MNRQIYTVFLLCLLAGMAGCYKDKGDYSYHPINDIVIKTQMDTFYVNKFDSLKIVPEILQSHSTDEGHLKYQWSVYLNAVDLNEPAHFNIEVLSSQRNLDIQVGVNAESAGPYNLDYDVTDTLTGVGYHKHLILYVSSALQNGWLLLEHKADHSDISFITTKQAVYHNVFSTANPDKVLPLTANAMSSVSISSGGIGALNFVLYDKDGYYMDKTSLQAIKPYSGFFYGSPAVVQPGCIQFPGIFTSLYTINNGQVYSLNALYGATLFGAAFQQPDGKGSVVAPFTAGGLSYGGIFFDQANYRFLNDGNATSLAAFPQDNTMVFDMNNVHKNLLTMKAGLGSASLPNNFYALFRDLDADSCFLYSISPNAEPVAQSKQAILNSPGVGNSVDWLFSSTLKLMYYAAGNQLYVYDMVANQSRVIYQFGNGENVSALQLQGTTILAATYNGNPGGGSVYYLPLSPTGDIQDNTYSQLFTGFDKIVFMTYKVG